MLGTGECASSASESTIPSCTSSSWRSGTYCRQRSEEHTSELQSRLHLVCRLLLEKKQLLQAALELHERLAQSLDLVGAQRADLDAPDRLALHQLADDVDELEHERRQPLLDVLAIR